MNKTMKHNLIATAAAALLAHAAMAQVPPPPVSPTPVTTYEYDAEGNPTKVTKAPDSLNLQNKASYDAQYRVKELTDPKNGKTAIEYDGGGRPTKVTDPRHLITQYPRNGFGDATQLISPDTGITNVTYDSARNLKTLTDSRGVTQTYTYDELNRVTSVVYTQSGQPSQTVTWTWDLTGPDYPYSIGRLSRTDHPSGFARVKYDPRGRITEAEQSVNAKAGANTVPIVTTVKYAYSHGDLMTITYPSGRVLVITRDVGELIGMSLSANAGGTPVPLISNVKWEPFGPVSGWDWNMASGLVTHMRQFDLSGRIVRYPLGNALRDVSYDAADRITGFTHLLASNGTAQPALDQSFGYDENSRLTSITTAASSWSIAYDPNGNRTSVSLNGSPSTYTTEATSNRLTSITNPTRSFGYDNAGNTTSDSAGYTATYAMSGSIASITKAGVTGSYDYDAERRRIRKVTSTGETVIFVYDLEGQLLGEYDQIGKPLREYVWLDNIPVAMFVPDPANASNPNAAPLVFYIHADHLNAPRIVVDQSGAKRWRWLAEPFGTTAPETSPDGLGAFTQNLRFPGQYADAESGLWYNHFRRYDSSTGRFSQSDPIGLAGGVNTYAYGDGSPTMAVDPSGLAVYKSRNEYSDRITAGRDWAIAKIIGDNITGWGSVRVPTVGDDFVCGADGSDGWGGNWGPKPSGDSGLAPSDEFNPIKFAWDTFGPDWTWLLPEVKVIQAMAAFGKVRKKAGSLGLAKGTDALRRENKMLNDAAREAGLTKDQQRLLHDFVGGDGSYSYQDLVRIAKEFKYGH